MDVRPPQYGPGSASAAGPAQPGLVRVPGPLSGPCQSASQSASQARSACPGPGGPVSPVWGWWGGGFWLGEAKAGLGVSVSWGCRRGLGGKPWGLCLSARLRVLGLPKAREAWF